MSHGDPRRRFLVLTPGIRGADGIAAVSRLVVRALDAQGGGGSSVDVLSVADSPPQGRLADGIQALGAGVRKARFAAAALRLSLMRSRHAWIVCLHARLAPAALLLARGDARLAIFLQGVEAWRRLGRVERRALARADLIIAISEHTATRFLEANGDYVGRPVRVCRLGVATGGSALEPPRPGEIRGAGAGSFALIVGRMAAEERYKGHDLLIDLWPRVIAEVPGARLLVVGDGDDRPRLERRAQALAGPVRFLGHVSDRDLARAYRDCAFFVMPSRAEGFGLVFLEAMRAGKACIGGLGAAAEVIEDGVTGLVVDPAEPEDVLKAVLRLFREPETRARMGRAGAARLAGQFTEAHFRERFRALLDLGQGPP